MGSKSKNPKRPHFPSGAVPRFQPDPTIAIASDGDSRIVFNTRSIAFARYHPRGKWDSFSEELDARLDVHFRAAAGSSDGFGLDKRRFIGSTAENLAAHLLIIGINVDNAAGYFRERFPEIAAELFPPPEPVPEPARAPVLAPVPDESEGGEA